MIRETIVNGKKETSVILHTYTCTVNKTTHQFEFHEETKPDLNNGKRHRVRSFVIAHDDKEYPNKGDLKKLLTPSKLEDIKHMNIKTSKEYGENLGGFCTKCLKKVKDECKKKFGGNW